MLLEHWEVTVVIEMVVGEQDDREVHKVGKVITREWWNVSSAKLFRLLEIIQVLDSISWVRCASGNVSLKRGSWKVCVRAGSRNKLPRLFLFFKILGLSRLFFSLSPSVEVLQQ